MINYSPYSDQELVILLKNSDESAFTELYDRYWKKLYFIGASKLNNLTAVEELVQDIFCDLWERRSNLELKGEISAYLSIAVKYKVINTLAKKKRLEDYEQHLLATLPHGINSTEEWLSFEELKDKLSILIEQLPEKARLAFLLNKEEGRSHKEIAVQMNTSTKAAERSIARAIQLLAAGLKYILFIFLI
ncbi:MAG TPA: sigma-70 family RNA polymerase sigma factor [Flavitalea sp.]|nr:sigma-70 family RNA polymerase sigma factor [Flavitalea sp.]